MLEGAWKIQERFQLSFWDAVRLAGGQSPGWFLPEDGKLKMSGR
jgi:hypothetical protein